MITRSNAGDLQSDSYVGSSTPGWGITPREWLGLRELTQYANISERTLRSWIYSPTDPLPAAKVRGKVLVRKADFDAYIQRHRIKPLAAIDIDRIIHDVLQGGRHGR